MMVPDDLRYSEDHQWVRNEGEFWRVGITDYAQEALGEVTMVTMCPQDGLVCAGDMLGEIEALKAITDLYMPVDAVVVESNQALGAIPAVVNSDPFGQGWLCLVRPERREDFVRLLDADAYRELITNG